MGSGYEKPNYTQIPNVLLDYHLPQMKESELKVVMAISRATFGWHKDKVKLSLADIMQRTGLTRQGAHNGIHAGIERGVIAREQDGQGFFYSLVIDEELVNEIDQSTHQTSQRNRLVNEIDQSTKETSTSQRNRPVLVNEIDRLPPTLKKVKEKKERESAPARKLVPHKPRLSGGESVKPKVISTDSPHIDESKIKKGVIAAGKGVNAVEVLHERYPLREGRDNKPLLTAPQEDDLIAAVKDMKKWRNVVTTWSNHGYSGRNIAGMLDWYRDGIPQRNGNQAQSTPTNWQAALDNQDVPDYIRQMQRGK